MKEVGQKSKSSPSLSFCIAITFIQYNYALYCIDVTGVSPNKGSINGRTTITIFGEHFNPNATEIEVLVGGE